MEDRSDEKLKGIISRWEYIPTRINNYTAEMQNDYTQLKQLNTRKMYPAVLLGFGMKEQFIIISKNTFDKLKNKKY